MNYREAVSYLESFINYEKIPEYPYKQSLKLERVRDFLSIIGNPQDSLRCIHVAGSKGKGSTCAFIAYILREAGYKVGLYTSPHLSDFRERIRILNPTRNPAHLVGVHKHTYEVCKGWGSKVGDDFEGMISRKEMVKLAARLRPVIDNYNKDSKYGPLTFFEVYTALAFQYFKEKKADFAVLETGLGGRLDATNVCNPLVCAITPISYEHTQKLGSSLREIATEKAGIIKTHRTSHYKFRSLSVISAPQQKEALDVICNKCKEVAARLHEVNPGEHKDLKIRLIGEHQRINANVAIGVIEALQELGINIPDIALKKGLLNTIWPGRCEVISKKPLIVLDGAQNIASALALKESIKTIFKYRKLILILGISNDKDIKGICNELNELADEVILTRADNSRATEPEVMEEYFSDKPTRITKNVKEALESAKKIAKAKDLVLVTGSLFLVGEARK
ncbi:MAG: bifunctional folylpolyglutamate synthase/dihydrofolate synthase [Candidatus Omnitrophica bacterium]|nr:bifunctional folylpolyglutamate synthase/dihydrofolate synthase [Candidatus Omnitrophota bacterium]MBU1869779.1 bifunctional folylpolyglutamate synthase/dihydrofolate synthase [Candidatus Omnitrophota bacterium]